MRYLFSFILTLVFFITTAQETWSLEDCISHAKINNLLVQKQQLQNESLAQDIITAKGNFYPDASFNGSQGFSLGNSFNVSTGVGQLESSFNSFSLASSLNVFNGFTNTYNLQKAKLISKKGVADLNQIQLDLTLQIIDRYLVVLFNKDIVNVAQQQVVISEQEVGRLESLYESQLTPKSELLQMKSTLANDTKELIIAKNNLVNSKILLKELLDINAIEEFEIEEIKLPEFEALELLSSPELIFTEALKTNPTITSIILSSEINKRNIKIGKAQFYPRLSFNYSYGSNYYHILGRDDLVFNQDTQLFEDNGFVVQLNNNRTHYLGLNLSLNIFNGFATKANLKKSQVQLRLTEVELKSAKNQLKNVIEIAYNDVLTAKAALDAAVSATFFQKEAFLVNQNKYRNTLITSLAFLESKKLFSKVESDLIQAKYDYLFKIMVLDYYSN